MLPLQLKAGTILCRHRCISHLQMCISNKAFLAERLLVYRETFVLLKIELDSDFHGRLLVLIFISIISVLSLFLFFFFKKVTQLYNANNSELLLNLLAEASVQKVKTQ